MVKILNSAPTYVSDSLNGLCAAFPTLTRGGTDGRFIERTTKKSKGKVGVVSGGGSGHLPLFCSYVGNGLLDSCAIGNVFEGPTVLSCSETIQSANQGAGVLLLFGNYGGDRMNFEMAATFASSQGIETRTVLGIDDIASAVKLERDKRRGVAGLVFGYKCAGAAAEAGQPLADVERIARLAVDRTATVGFATSGCVLPGSDKPSFQIPDGMVSFGMGIHGEPGLWTRAMPTSKELAAETVELLLSEKPEEETHEVVLMVNSLGATPIEELLILCGDIHARLKDQNIKIRSTMVGPYVTSMEMAGASVSLLYLNEVLDPLVTAPCNSPFWRV